MIKSDKLKSYVFYNTCIMLLLLLSPACALTATDRIVNSILNAGTHCPDEYCVWLELNFIPEPYNIEILDKSQKHTLESLKSDEITVKGTTLLFRLPSSKQLTSTFEKDGLYFKVNSSNNSTSTYLKRKNKNPMEIGGSAFPLISIGEDYIKNPSDRLWKGKTGPSSLTTVFGSYHKFDCGQNDEQSCREVAKSKFDKMIQLGAKTISFSLWVDYYNPKSFISHQTISNGHVLSIIDGHLHKQIYENILNAISDAETAGFKEIVLRISTQGAMSPKGWSTIVKHDKKGNQVFVGKQILLNNIVNNRKDAYIRSLYPKGKTTFKSLSISQKSHLYAQLYAHFTKSYSTLVRAIATKVKPAINKKTKIYFDLHSEFAGIWGDKKLRFNLSKAKNTESDSRRLMKSFAKKIYLDFIKEFSTEDTVGFSFSTHPGRFTAMSKLYEEISIEQAKDLRPTVYAFDMYTGLCGKLATLADEMKNTDLNRGDDAAWGARKNSNYPIFILETTYDDVTNVNHFIYARENFGLNIRKINHWPLTRDGVQKVKKRIHFNTNKIVPPPYFKNAEYIVPATCKVDDKNAVSSYREWIKNKKTPLEVIKNRNMNRWVDYLRKNYCWPGGYVNTLTRNLSSTNGYSSPIKCKNILH